MKEILKKFLRSINLIVLQSRDVPVVTAIKVHFAHSERSFIYNGVKRLVDALDFEASPGVAESIIVELDREFKCGKGKKLMNLGSGSGQASEIYRRLGFDVYSLDLRTEADDSRNAHFDLNGDGSLPFSNERFDVVICQEVIEHIENPWKLFRQAKAMLLPGGIFIVSTPNILSRHNRLLFLLSGYYHWFRPRDFAYHINPIPAWEMGLIAQRNGFVPVSLRGNGDYFLGRSARRQGIIGRNEILVFTYRLPSGNGSHD